MCLLVLAWNCHPKYRVVLAANRDEFHERPATALGWWLDEPHLLAGRDQRAGGAWLGLTRGGRMAVLTNVRDADAVAHAAAPSRGALVRNLLSAADEPAAHLAALAVHAGAYAGFNLLAADARSLHYFSNAEPGPPRALEPGVYALSNHRLDTPWPKVERTRAAFSARLAAARLAPNALFELLADDRPAEGGEPSGRPLPADLERALSAPFVRHPRYGTRCSSVALVEHDGRSIVAERRYDAAGAQTGASRFEFRAAA